MNAGRYTWRVARILLVVSMALLLALIAVIAPAAAQPKDVELKNPNTPLFSDGRSVQSEATPFTGQEVGAAPYAGTGILSPKSGVNTADVGVQDLQALRPANGGDSIETLIGLDTRVRTYTRSYPARAVVLITFTGGWCTGWIYGPNVVATAGHCVHAGPGGTWRANVRVYPGYDGTVAPYGSCTARWLASVAGWVSSGNELYDYGAIKLNCTVGNTTGWFGFWWQAASLTGLPAITSGYPGDKSLQQWWSFDVIRYTEVRQIYYYNDTVGGMSGSPVWQDRPPGSAFCANGPCVLAIHAYGLHGAFPHNTYNHGTRISEPVFTNLINWRNAP